MCLSFRKIFLFGTSASEVLPCHKVLSSWNTAAIKVKQRATQGKAKRVAGERKKKERKKEREREKARERERERATQREGGATKGNSPEVRERLT
jgi:hypothetical protein